MLEYFKDGNKVECKPIYGHGYVGQIVIFDHVSYGEKPDLVRDPIAAYPQPYPFTIVEKVEGSDGYYVISDSKGNLIKLQTEHFGASFAYLYDAIELLEWRKGHEKEQIARKERKIQQLEGNLALLKSILIAQGIRVVSNETAKQLGIA